MTDDRRQIVVNLVVLSVCAIAFIAAGAFLFVSFRDMQTKTRGIEFGARAETAFGVNVALEQYSDADLTRALSLIRDGGFSYIRQHFYWNELEPRQNEFAWKKSDRIVARANEFGLQVIAVIDTTPVWARHPGEADLVNTPPANPDDYGRFVAAFVKRYGDRVRHIQIWDNPNVHPFWGRRNADPIEYAALLRSAATHARAVNPQVKILSAGLGYSSELIRGHPDYSDILFLRGLYEVGAQQYFDSVGAKAYGMWSGPDDRRADKDVFNFSRVILLRDEMLAYGDAHKPIWAVEFGWNALPQGWSGKPSPWGSDAEETQSARLAGAVQRARSEWAWMPVLIAQTLQPNAPSDDPVWGFSLVDKNLQPRAMYTALTRALAAPVQPAAFDFTRFYLTFGAGALVALIAAACGALAAWRLPWEIIWQPIQARFAALPELAQFAWLAVAAIALDYSPNAALNFALLALLVFLFALRLDLGLAITVFTIPFYLLPKNLIGGAQFSMVELFVLVSAAAWFARVTADRRRQIAAFSARSAVSRLRSSDWAVLCFVLLGLLAVKIASNFGVAMREFRVIVLEPALLYALIRASNLSRRDLQRLVNAFILSAVAVSLIGLYQFFFTNWVIIGEGVRRVLAVYGSPNNLALYLDRALPLALALALLGRLEVAATTSQSLPSQTEPTKVGFAKLLQRIYSPASALIIALALYLTYSRGAWLGIAAGFVFIALASDRRARVVLIGVIVIGIIASIPFLQTERAQSLFQIGTGTGFFRVSVWESAAAMIRDHPIFGVGLDNFLYEYPKYIKPDAWREPNLSHPHNIVLDFWARLGIAGVIVVAWMILEFYRKGIGELRELGGTGRARVIGLMAS
ncbi:MAG: O-antigen ligase family protein, partial [Chloroflexota bacterium]